MLGCEIVEKSKIAFRARAPGRRNPHSSSSPGKPDTWQRGIGDPMAGTWRDAKCKLPRRSSPSTENVADTETDLAQGHVGHEAQDPHRLRAMPRRDPRRTTDEDTRGSGGTNQRIGPLESRMTRKCPVRFGGGRMENDAAGYPSRLTQTGSRTPASDRTSPAAYPTRTSTDAQKPFVETLRVGIPPGKAGTSSRKRVLRAVVGDHNHEA